MTASEERLLSLLDHLDEASVLGEVLDLLPTVDLNYADSKHKQNCLHRLALAKPCHHQLTVGRGICELLRQRRQQLDENCCLYSLSARGNDAITVAAQKCHQTEDGDFKKQLVELLLDTDQILLNRYAENSDRQRLFCNAVEGGRKELLETLAHRFGWDSCEDHCILAKIRTVEFCSLPQVAAVNGNAHLLRWFNEDSTWHSVPLNMEDGDGEIPLSDAAARGRYNAVEYLIEFGGSNVNHRSRMGDTPLFRALKNDRLKVAKILLKAGAKTSIKDYGRNTALHVLLQMPEKYQDDQENKRMTKDEYTELLQLFADQVNSENLVGHRPLHSCVAERNWVVLEAAVEFLKGQKKVTLKAALTNSCGVNVLHTFFSFHSSEADRNELKRILGENYWNRFLKKRTSIAKKNDGDLSAGFSCLHFACKFNNINALDYLTSDNVRFQLSDRTADGRTGVDLLLSHYSFEDVRQIFSKYEKQSEDSDSNLKELCSLVDPVRAASSQRPEQKSLHRLARKLQYLCTDELERSELLRFPTASLDGFISGRVGLARDSRQYERQVPLGAKLLARCCETDDSKGAAGLAAIGLLDGMWRPEFQRDLFSAWKRGIVKPDSSQAKPPEPSDLIEFCIEQQKYEVCQELLRYRQFDLVPTCLQVMIKCNTDIDSKDTNASRRAGLLKLRATARNVLLNALEALDVDALDTKETIDLVGKFLDGHVGPKYRKFGEGDELSVEQLLERCEVKEVFATGCVRRLVENSWEGAQECCAPRRKFAMNLVAHIVFTVCLSVFITMGESCSSLRAPAGLALYIVLAAFTLDFLILDLRSIGRSVGWKGQRTVGHVVKFLLAFLGPLLLLAGLVAVPIAEFASPSALYGAHMSLATAYLVMALRLLAYLRWFNVGHIGPTVGIIERLLLQDLLPFLLIFFVFIAASGVFFQVLLHPSRRAFAFANGEPQSLDVGEAIVGVYARPLLLAFGELEVEGLRSCLAGQNCSDLKDSNCTCPHGQGARLYLALFAIVFLIISLALLNLLIAKFNLTVNRGVGMARVTWCYYRYKMLRHFQWLPPGPPPLRWILLIVPTSVCRCRGNEVQPHSSTAKSMDDFLWLQARKFRNKRRDIALPVMISDEDATRVTY